MTDVNSEIIPSYLISVGVPGFPSLTLINLSQSIGTVAEKNDFLTGLPGQSGQEAARVIAIVSVLLSLLLVVGLHFPDSSNILSTMFDADVAGNGKYVSAKRYRSFRV